MSSMDMNDINEAQKMWIDILDCILSQKSFNLAKGDLDYVFRNMIAKMISSADFYWVTDGVERLIEEKGLSKTEPIPTKKYFYGKRSGNKTVFEHVVPVSFIRDYLKDNRQDGKNRENITECIRKSGGVTIMLREEDRRLSDQKLSRKMPRDWHIGDDPFKRYDAAGIKRPTLRIRRIGPICR